MVDTNLNEVEKGVHNFSSEKKWVKPDKPILNEQIEWFKDQKLGLMMHWGPYSQLGLVESWALSDEDGDWSRDDIDWIEDMEEFKKQYFDLNKTFNPVRFQPKEWAKLAKDSGFKYLVFTTKHHDGFSMWDTGETDYKVTGEECPFHNNKNADICKNLFNAFRDQGLGISAYFSKADWHSPFYWAPDMERGRHMWRGPSYNPSEHPKLWDEFVKFTHNQILELFTNYGKIDVLWLDAGWVSARNNQDIRLGEVVEKAREKQPWLLSADRLIGGPYENIITPEQTIPKDPIHAPWESCITMGTAFSFRYEDEYKSTRKIIHLLIEVVAKGGNLALNVAPQPDGRLPRTAVQRMKELGEWLEKYGEGIYGTRVLDPYYLENESVAFTKKGDTVYCFYLYKDEEAAINKEIFIPYTDDFTKVELVSSNAKLTYMNQSEGFVVTLPETELKEKAPVSHLFRIV
ncbi:alpha-L-fucosidase [Halalkalibacter kiskunsagensis]|uniref:alpha-L-fucosidase n=1 Tax=Halalkalibacter kiskunsagensis TaxID=1548599 RepID=A0ABV6KEP3_9BACI